MTDRVNPDRDLSQCTVLEVLNISSNKLSELFVFLTQI